MIRCDAIPCALVEPPTPITPEQQRDCAHVGDAENASRPKAAQEMDEQAAVNLNLTVCGSNLEYQMDIQRPKKADSVGGGCGRL
jgi:hypothetical protein